ncbi:peptidoglycan-binding domain-containing protein [Streptomyces sp. NPDC003016]
MNGHVCPECGTDRGAASDDAGRPGCGCAERAARAVRAERSAEIAAAEDFDPLRIRPYVTLQETDDGASPPSYAEPEGTTAMTMPLGVLNGPGHEGGPGRDATGTTDTTAVMGAVPSYGPPPGAGPGYGADPGFGSGVDPGFGFGFGFGEEPSGPRRQQRKGPVLWLAVSAAAAAVVGTAAFAGGLFSGEDEREHALPDVVTSVPSASDGPETSASESGAGSQSPSPSASASASASPSASTSTEASASTSASASGSRSAAASASASADASKPTASAAPSTARTTTTAEKPPEPAAATLRRGDRGPEVAELQDRLAQLWLYRSRKNGHFSDRVEEAVRTYQSYKYIQGDPEGTYGPHTRRALEAETEEP